MRISIDWLRDFIDVDLPTSRLIDALNTIGLLVDSWEESGDDVILELETYANRPDTLGYLGVARELSVALNIPLREQNWPLTELDELSSDSIDIEIYDEDLCPRYCGIGRAGLLRPARERVALRGAELEEGLRGAAFHLQSAYAYSPRIARNSGETLPTDL